MDRKTAREKAQALVARMTLEEKTAQLRYNAPAIERLGVPAYNWWNEALHGVARGGTATSFPQAIGLAAMFDDALLEQLGDVAATEGRAKYTARRRRRDRGTGQVQRPVRERGPRHLSRPDLLVPEHQHLPRPPLGPRA